MALVLAVVFVPAAQAEILDLPAVSTGRLEGGGSPVASAGDVNGDGREDVIVAADLTRGGTVADRIPESADMEPAGGAYVVLGRPDLGVLELGKPGAAGFRILGARPGDEAGRAVAGAGDVNGDGFADVLLTAPRAEGVSRRAPARRLRSVHDGAAYVVFGSRTPADVDLARLGDRGIAIRGIEDGDVAGIGDFNGDGRADVAVGDQGSYLDGGAKVILGGTAPGTFDVARAGSRGITVRGASGDLNAGLAVSAAGDANGDGLADLAIGAPTSLGRPLSPARRGEIFGPGAAYVVFGRASRAPIRLGRLAGGGYRIRATRSLGFVGFSLAGAGDVNGDGRGDIVVGAPVHGLDRRRTSPIRGAAFVVFGASASADVDLDRLGDRGLKLRGERAAPGAGVSVAGAGDLNGDRLADVLIGATGIDGDDVAREDPPTMAYAVFGRATPGSMDLAGTRSGLGGLAFRGLAGDALGRSVAAADLDGDGVRELILAATSGCDRGARAVTPFGERWGAEPRVGGAVYVHSLGSAGPAAPGARIGTGAADELAGGTGDDRIAGRAGDDRISGGDGGDCLYGDEGADALDGGPGGDAVFGGPGPDRIAGGPGDDALRGHGGADTVDAGPGQDTLDGGARDDRLSGGAGPDELDGGTGDDRLHGGPGPDELAGGRGDDTIDARDGARDTILCGHGRDRVRADRRDRVTGCEVVRYSSAARSST